jgi:outer membrane lipoprotein SlyB
MLRALSPLKPPLMKLPLNASQTIAVFAIAAAMAAGAYALGRSQNTAPSAPLKEDLRVAPALAEAAQPAMTAEPPAAVAAEAALCKGCSRVVSVHSEMRQAQSTSGVGAVGGAVVGGLLGSRFGGGDGRKLATVGGAVAGGFAGNAIEKNAKQHRVWMLELQDERGMRYKREQANDPKLGVGDVVSQRDGRLVRR